MRSHKRDWAGEGQRVREIRRTKRKPVIYVQLSLSLALFISCLRNFPNFGALCGKSSFPNWPSASHDPRSVILCVAYVFRFGPPKTWGVRVKVRVFLCQPLSHQPCSAMPLFLTLLVILSIRGEGQIATLGVLGFRPSDSTFTPLHLSWGPVFLDFLPACRFYSCSSSGHLATLDKQLVLFSLSLSPSTSSQPHIHSTPYYVASALAVTPWVIWAIFRGRWSLLNPAKYITQTFYHIVISKRYRVVWDRKCKHLILNLQLVLASSNHTLNQ